MSVDDELLNQDNQDDDPSDRVADLNEAQHTARIEKKEKEAKEKKKKSLVPKKLNSMQRTLASFTRSSWTYLFIFFFLPIVWIDIHWLGGYLGFKKMFVPLGSEWFARPGVDEKKAKRLGKGLNMPESIGCACVNFGCLIVLLFVLVVISLVMCSMDIECLLKVVWALIQATWDKIKSFFTSN